MRKYQKSTQRNSSANSATSIGLTDLRQSPLHLNRVVHQNRLVERETEMETTEIFQLRVSITDLRVKCGLRII
jgi:hypothetical protein